MSSPGVLVRLSGNSCSRDGTVPDYRTAESARRTLKQQQIQIDQLQRENKFLSEEVAIDSKVQSAQAVKCAVQFALSTGVVGTWPLKNIIDRHCLLFYSIEFGSVYFLCRHAWHACFQRSS